MFIRGMFFALTSLLLAGGCASITRGTMDSLVVESDPSGAAVEIRRKDRQFTKAEVGQNRVDESGVIVGTTPSSFRLKREGSYNVVVSKDGYETVESSVSHSVAGGGAAGMAGNVLLGGVIGAVVDSNTGAMHNLMPNPLNVVLKPRKEPGQAGGQTRVEVVTAASAEVRLEVSTDGEGTSDNRENVDSEDSTADTPEP